jgi:hypothetical protein
MSEFGQSNLNDDSLVIPVEDTYYDDDIQDLPLDSFFTLPDIPNSPEKIRMSDSLLNKRVRPSLGIREPTAKRTK